MPDQQPIYVNGKLFLGRVEEQKQFRATLRDTLALPNGEELPYIVLLYGDGGMGKTSLAQRFCDIATLEPPYEGQFATLWLDWEEERRRHPALQVGREFISPETVFDRLHAAFLRGDNGWGRQFRAYQKLVDQRDEIEKKAAEILTGGGDNDDLIRTLRGASTTALAKVIRWRVPIGDTGEKLAQQFLEAGVIVAAGQAANLRHSMETRLQARLKPEQYRLYLNPHEQLALALGDGLKKVAGRKPLILFLDTYEIVDRADDWLREVIKAAGPRLVWVIGGRRNLLSNRQDGPDYFRGYGDAFPRRLLAYDMRQLALADVAAYFADAAPERPLSEAETAAISQATRGIPLAIKTAAEIWQKGVSLAEVVGDLTSATPHQEIVGQMTARYLLHVVDDADRAAIYALALARGDLDVLRRMLQPVVDEPFDLTPRLAELRRDYAAVHLQEARLHEEPAAFLTAHLHQTELRTSPPIQRLNERAVVALEYRLAALEAELPLLEERCEDEDWVKAAVDMARYLFWLDEQRGWQWLIPRFVEGLAYSRDLWRGLLDVAAEWQADFSWRSKRRLKKLNVGTRFSTSVEDEAEMLQALNDLDRPGMDWLKGSGMAERKAILSLLWGKLYVRQKEYRKALPYYDKAEAGLSDAGEGLKRQLGEALDDLAGKLMWPDETRSVVYSPEAERILHRVIVWLPESEGAWYRLGAVHWLNGCYNEAIAACKKAAALDPNDAHIHNGLGNAYAALSRYSEAIAAYQKAIDLDPNLAPPHCNLGNVYYALGHTAEAIAAYQQAINLDPNDAVTRGSLAGLYRNLGQEAEYEAQVKIARELIGQESEYNRACFEAICGNVPEAIALLEQAIAKAPGLRQSAQTDPDFDFIRDDPRFQALVGTAVS